MTMEHLCLLSAEPLTTARLEYFSALTKLLLLAEGEPVMEKEEYLPGWTTSMLLCSFEGQGKSGSATWLQEKRTVGLGEGN